MNTEKPKRTLTLLETLQYIEPLSSGRDRTHPMRKAQQISNWLLGFSFLCFVLVGGFALWHMYHPLSSGVKFTAITIGLLCQILALLAIMISPICAVFSLCRWKKISWQTFLNEVKKEQKHVARLVRFCPSELQMVEQHLILKLRRVEGRITVILGKETAVLSLLALTIPIIKDLDSLGWFDRVFNENLFANSWGGALFYFLMFILGLSLGSLALKPVYEYYRYKLDLVQLALNKVNDQKKK
ncbi:hypothetical protein EV681_3094 [Advenella incenata]|uniref:Uncharacterized protein n=1 Tax=Advenella incenata TaxID=267800 RepID=A0A4Q7VFE2_9BURK|nr:hypothetical protein [Advenella incenata]RZT94673.1 hypothetical protein EV681_3094 [Advenella incenata]